MKFLTALFDFLWGLVLSLASGITVGMASLSLINSVLGKVTVQTTETELVFRLIIYLACLVVSYPLLWRHVFPKQ